MVIETSNRMQFFIELDRMVLTSPFIGVSCRTLLFYLEIHHSTTGAMRYRGLRDNAVPTPNDVRQLSWVVFDLPLGTVQYLFKRGHEIVF